LKDHQLMSYSVPILIGLRPFREAEWEKVPEGRYAV
jgi:hypothetical protein